MDDIFFQLAGILLMAFLVSSIVRAFRQPIVIGYIIAGMVIAFIIKFGGIDLGASNELIKTFSHFGIAFLLFIVGLHLNPRVIKEIGTSSLLIGLVQMVFTFVLGFAVSMLLGFDLIASVFVGIALMFSSTIIVMKLISDKRQLDSLYGKISIGILIIQDLVAIAVLMFISSMSGGTDFVSFGYYLFGGIGLIVVLFLMGYFIFPKLIHGIAKSQELLFLFSICWCFVIAALFGYFKLGIEIGALIAGVVLSLSPYSTEISSKIRPLRDFFLIVFFIILGLNVILGLNSISDMGGIIFNALAFSLVVLIFKPLVLMVFTAIFGYTKRTNFLVGITLAQISEFSIIILGLGAGLGYITNDVLSTLTLTLIITITLSTYLIIYSNGLYSKMSRVVSFFERKNIKKEQKIEKEYDAILLGYNRIGFSILNSLKKIKKNYLVVDFNPDTIDDLKKFRIPCIYGDAYDLDFLQELPLDKIKLIVSTIPDFEINFLMIEAVRMVNKDAIIIARSHQIEEALKLYRKGASYVLTPHFLGGEYVSKMIEFDKVREDKYQLEKEKHIKNLKKMQVKGHRHPEVE